MKTRHVCVSLDIPDASQLLSMATKLAPYVCAMKLHSDIISPPPSRDFYAKLQNLSRKHNVMLIEDRKFCDIGNTVRQQFAPYAQWADAVTVHVIAGPGTIESLIAVKPNVQIIVVASMSSKGTLTDESYFNRAVLIGCRYPNNVIGFVTQRSLPKDVSKNGFRTFTPGIRIGVKRDDNDQQYRSPREVVKEVGTDIAIVGRGIINAKDPVAVVKAYEQAFN